MKLLGFKVIGVGNVNIHYKLKKEVKTTIMEKTVQDCVINDIIQACQDDLESKENNKNVIKIIREIVRGVINE